MFGIGGTELIIILLFAFLIVGPDKLPEVAKTLGAGVAKFRNAQDQMNEVIKNETEAIKSEVDASRKERKTVKVRLGEDEKKDEKPSEPASSAESVEEKPAEEQPKKTLSFSERKALYEKEKAAKAEAEKAAAQAEKGGE